MRKKCLTVISLFLINFNAFAQTTGIETVGSPQHQNNIPGIIGKINEADISHLFAYFILIVAVIVAILLLLNKMFSSIFNKVEDLKIGPISLKTKKKHSDVNTGHGINNSVDLDTILSLFEFIMKSEMKVIINDTISSINDVHKIENDYDENVKNVFEKTFSIIERDLHDKLVNLACKVTKFNLMDVKNTREYFFISDLLNEYRRVWKEDAKEITRRNGFVEFLNDRTKAEPYINELANAINQCIDMGKLESTDIPKSEIDNIIKDSYRDYHTTLDNMFYNLASMKSKMFARRDEKMDKIESDINDTSKRIVDEIRSQIFDHMHENNKSISMVEKKE